MKICRDLQSKPLFSDAVIAVGMFDGVHRGHQAIMREASEWAEPKGTPVALTFADHPAEKVGGVDIRYITSLEKRISLIEKAGMAGCIVLDFTNEIASLDPVDFISDIIIKRTGGTRIVAGKDWRFGSNRSGDSELLLKMQKDKKLEVRFVPPVSIDGHLISSSAIRNAISSGDITTASKMLGRPFSIIGKVVHGSNRGTKLGFPTANLDMQRMILPPEGVYGGATRINGAKHKCVISIGTKPTFANQDLTIEVHVPGFKADLYESIIEAEVHFFMREQWIFSSDKALAAQIAADVDSVMNNSL